MRNKVAKGLREVAKSVGGNDWKKTYKNFKKGYKRYQRTGEV